MKYCLLSRSRLFLLCLFLGLTLFKGHGVSAAEQETGYQTVTITHVHEGTGQQAGGCYGTPVYCRGRMEERTLNPHGCGISASGGGCAHCGCWYEPPSGKYPSGCAHCNCPKPTVNSCTVCGRQGGGGTCSGVNGYALNCGKGNAAIARLSLRKNTEEWCRELMLEAEYELLEQGLTAPELPFRWNGQAPSGESLYPVRKNGIYSCGLNLGSNTDAGIRMVTILIDHIDQTPPAVMVDWGEEKEFVRERKIRITAEDLQEDGSMGCGLPEQPYSFDGGVHWSDLQERIIIGNGPVMLHTRDALGNTESLEADIQNIDRTAPQMHVVQDGDFVTIQAEDLQEDGTPGAGLSEQPYSFDGGESWTAEKQKKLTDAGVYRLCVRDRLDNQSFYVYTIEENSDPGGGNQQEIEKIPEIKDMIPSETSPEEAPLETKTAPPVQRSQEQSSEQSEVTAESNRTFNVRRIVPARLKKKEKSAEPVSRQGEQRRKLLWVLLGISLTTALLILIFLLLHSVRVYARMKNGQFCLLGILLLRKEDTYVLQISDSMLEKAESIYWKCRPHPLFAKIFRHEMLVIYGEGFSLSEKIDTEIQFIQKELRS